MKGSLIIERTRAGVKAAQSRGVTIGRKPKLTAHRVNHARKLFETGEAVEQVAALLGIDRATVYRALDRVGQFTGERSVLKKITKLQSIGLFQSGAPTPAHFDHVTLLYGENGRGKSTLATLLRACALGDSAKLQAKKTLDATTPQEAALLFEIGGKNTLITFSNGAWNASVPQIVVFDAA